MDFVKKIESHLKDMNYQLAAMEILSPDNIEHIHSEGMDIIAKVCEIGLQDAEEMDDVSTCSELLNYICNCYNPKLALVSILEQAESFIRSPKFSIILNAIQIVFARHPAKRAATYSWTLELLNKHLREFHKFPKELNNKLTETEGQQLLLENDSRISSILKYYKDVLVFYGPIISEFLSLRESLPKKMSAAQKKELKAQERVLKSCLIDLLGSPLIYFDLAWSEEEPKSPKSPRRSRSRMQVKKPPIESRKLKTDARLLAEQIMNFISQVNADSASLLKWAERKCLPQPVLTEEDVVDDYDANVEEVKMERVAVGNYFYLVYVENLAPNQMPMVYNTTHLFHVQLPLVLTLLEDQFQNCFATQKGLLLVQKLIGQIKDPLDTFFVTGDVYSRFLQKLSEIIVFDESKPVRQLGLAVMKSYFWVFDPPGKYKFFQFILAKVNHSGLRGFMIGQLKDCVAAALSDKEKNQEDLKQNFLGQNLINVILQICTLKDGTTTDLMEKNDQIVAVLNLIRYLLIRDGNKNASGILNVMPKIETVMLKPLRTAVDMTKSHYKLRLREIEDGGNKQGAKTESSFSLTIGNKEVDMEDVSVEDQVKAVNAGLLNIDVMESLLARVNECYSNINKSN